MASETKESISYKAFVEQEIKYWRNKGIKWNPPKTDNDDEKNNKKIKYTEDIIEHLIVTVYENMASTQKTSAFTKLLLLFSHQLVIGRILASYAQIPEYLRNIHVNNKVFTTTQLLDWKWNEKGNKNNIISVDFRRVYIILLTNYLNRMWMFYHVDLKKEAKIKPGSDEYIHIETIQQHLNEIIDSTKVSTSNKVKLSKNVVYEKIASNCLSLLGAIIDSLHFKYEPIIVHNLQELHNIISLIALQINQIYAPIEDEWIRDAHNYEKNMSPVEDIDGEDNFVTLVFQEYDKAQAQKVEKEKHAK